MKAIVAVFGKRCKFCGGELFFTGQHTILTTQACYVKADKRSFTFRLKLFSVYDNSLAGTTRICGVVPAAKEKKLGMMFVYTCSRCGEEREYVSELSDLNNSEVG